jgi:hypothetical protein
MGLLGAVDRFENLGTGVVLEIVRAPGDRGGALELRMVLTPGTGRPSLTSTATTSSDS